MENVKVLIRTTFPGDEWMAIEVAKRESSGIQMIQSNYRYTASNVPHGYKVGDREQSFCIFQIHAPVHQATANSLGLGDFRTNVESCVAMARVIYEQRNNTFAAWSVTKDILAMI